MAEVVEQRTVYPLAAAAEFAGYADRNSLRDVALRVEKNAGIKVIWQASETGAPETYLDASWFDHWVVTSGRASAAPSGTIRRFEVPVPVPGSHGTARPPSGPEPAVTGTPSNEELLNVNARLHAQVQELQARLASIEQLLASQDSVRAAEAQARVEMLEAEMARMAADHARTLARVLGAPLHDH